MRFTGVGGYTHQRELGIADAVLTVQPRNVSISWIGRDNFEATALIGTSRIFFNPRPTRLPGLQTTSIDEMRVGSRICSRWSASNDAMLNSSDPQNKIRSGSCDLDVEFHRRAREGSAIHGRVRVDAHRIPELRKSNMVNVGSDH